MSERSSKKRKIQASTTVSKVTGGGARPGAPASQSPAPPLGSSSSSRLASPAINSSDAFAAVKPPPAELDVYRLIPSVYKKPLLRFTGGTSTPLNNDGSAPAAATAAAELGPSATAQSLLSVKSHAYSSRLANRSLLLVNQPPPEQGTPAYDEWSAAQRAIAKGKKTQKMRVIGKEGMGSWEVGARPVSGDGVGRVGIGWTQSAAAAASSAAKAAAVTKSAPLVGDSIPIRRSKKQKRKLYELKKGPKAGSKILYSQLLQLHYMYLSYLSELLSLPAWLPPMDSPAGKNKDAPASSKLPPGLGSEAITSKLIKADFVGSLMRVKKAKNECLDGIEGIVVQETAETIKLVTKKDAIKVIPKQNSLFTLSFPAYSFASIPHAPGSRWYASSHGFGQSTIDIYTADPFAHLSDPSAVAAAADSFDFDPFAADVAFETELARVPRIEMDILGTAICTRPADRAGKRFKYSVGGSGWAEDWLPDLSL